MTSTSEHISIRIPAELLEIVDRRARQAHRSRSSMIQKMLWDAIANWPTVSAKFTPVKGIESVTATSSLRHSENCKCLMCKPLKGGAQ